MFNIFWFIWFWQVSYFYNIYLFIILWIWASLFCEGLDGTSGPKLVLLDEVVNKTDTYNFICFIQPCEISRIFIRLLLSITFDFLKELLLALKLHIWWVPVYNLLKQHKCLTTSLWSFWVHEGNSTIRLRSAILHTHTHIHTHIHTYNPKGHSSWGIRFLLLKWDPPRLHEHLFPSSHISSHVNWISIQCGPTLRWTTDGLKSIPNWLHFLHWFLDSRKPIHFELFFHGISRLHIRGVRNLQGHVAICKPCVSV